ncbi:Hypothetical predicted protein [Pelobates cultripes]|uniref:Uncharacterized protein n=1 Tax=Pelobates cultripes TaxID=61616 RepID=A0AAD1TNJ6_PELCU|nr:Hypothetical predicted protein [Pelobates cultripes]
MSEFILFSSRNRSLRFLGAFNPLTFKGMILISIKLTVILVLLLLVQHKYKRLLFDSLQLVS